jgi:hypothetical protein
MTNAHQSWSCTMISLLGCLLLSTPVLAQTGGAGGSVNGGATPSPGPVGIPIIPGTVANAAPTNEPGTYGGMEAPRDSALGTNPNCSLSGPNCYNLNGFPQEMPMPPPEPPQ